ncbi:golgin subfamily A member 4-like isoform X3 [Rissa tridactyla]|uniref:golgin subfamily A member 4-like isoform X3 n=1 Tax=Rissa tridactyla TaxID=75485 RepID=UPI0023BAB20C|nr:golgin subfamily A member 4-like isoform X3 [Rissa tridactyla]
MSQGGIAFPQNLPKISTADNPPRRPKTAPVPENRRQVSQVDEALGGASSWEAKGMMESGKRNADLEEWDAKIRKLTEEFEESDTELEECDTENGELTEEIDNLTAELEERDRKISKLAAELEERDRKITKLAAEVRRLTALLGDRDSRLRKLTAELTKCDATIRIFTVELGEQHTKIGELTADVRDCNRKIRRLRELLEERDSEIRKLDARIRKLTEELEERKEEAGDGAAEEPEESDLERDELMEELDKVTEELGERDKKIEEITEELAERGARINELTAELGERDAKIDELSAEVEKRDRKIDELTAELEEYKAKTRKCMEEHSFFRERGRKDGKRDAGPGDGPPPPGPLQGSEERQVGIRSPGVSRQPRALRRRPLRLGLRSLHLRETLLGGGPHRGTVLRHRGHQRVPAEEGTHRLQSRGRHLGGAAVGLSEPRPHLPSDPPQPAAGPQEDPRLPRLRVGRGGLLRRGEQNPHLHFSSGFFRRGADPAMVLGGAGFHLSGPMTLAVLLAPRTRRRR